MLESVLLAHPLEHQHVGVHGHADGEHEPGDPGQGQGGPQCQQHGERQQPVGQQRHRGQAAEQPIVGDHVQHGQGRADHRGLRAGPDGGLTQGRAHGALLDHLDRDGQRSGADEQGQVLGLAVGEVAGDHCQAATDPLLAGDRRVDLGAGDDLAVEHDGHPPGRVPGRLAGGLAGQLGPAAAAVALEVDGDLPAGLELGIELGAGVADGLAGQGGRAEAQTPAALVAHHQAVLAGRALGVGFGQAEHRVEGQLGGAPDDLGGLLGIVDAGQLDDHPPVPRALQGRLGHAELVDPSAQHLQGAGQGVAVDPLVGAVGGLQDDLGAAPQVQAEAGRAGGHQPAGRADQQQHGDKTPPKVTRQRRNLQQQPTPTGDGVGQGSGRLEAGWGPRSPGGGADRRPGRGQAGAPPSGGHPGGDRDRGDQQAEQQREQTATRIRPLSRRAQRRASVRQRGRLQTKE
jgi:hypothetical protein